MVGKNCGGGVINVVLERNGKVVGVNYSVNRGGMDLSGRGKSTLRQVGVYKNGINSMVGQDRGGGVSNVVLERNGKELELTPL